MWWRVCFPTRSTGRVCVSQLSPHPRVILCSSGSSTVHFWRLRLVSYLLLPQCWYIKACSSSRYAAISPVLLSPFWPWQFLIFYSIPKCADQIYIFNQQFYCFSTFFLLNSNLNCIHSFYCPMPIKFFDAIKTIEP